MPQPQSGIFLRDGPLTVGIAPDCGGALTRFDVRTGNSTLDILRPAVAQDPATRCSLGASCFPLVPYGGRLRRGEFEFEGRRYRFPLNALPERHSSHGDGWTRRWTLSHLGRGTAVMHLSADESAPFPYECRQSIEITRHRLRIDLHARNLGEHRIPMGLGLHPYFANRSGARISAALPTRWLWDHEMMPVSRAANPDAASLLRNHRVIDLPAAAEYADWDGSAAIGWPAMGLRVELKTQPPLKHAVFWMPAGKDFFCFEPVMHATDALNRHPMREPAEDFLILEPGAAAQQRFDFLVSCPEPHSP